MANIRNQCSWVHSNDWEAATTKAKDLVRMALARAAHLEPQHTFAIPVQNAALVVGGGPAGLTAACYLAESGFPVHLVEKRDVLGGNLRNVFTCMPEGAYQGRETLNPQERMAQLIEQVGVNRLITIHLASQVVATQGFVGNFTSTIQHADGSRSEISYGAAILATGGQEYKGSEFGYQKDPRILTQLDFEAWLAGWGAPGIPDQVKSVVMILCVGPAEKYCSRICCTVALKNALALKEKMPDARVVILNKDIRSADST